MKIVAFNGSPAGKNSATDRILEAFLAGAAEVLKLVTNILYYNYNFFPPTF